MLRHAARLAGVLAFAGLAAAAPAAAKEQDQRFVPLGAIAEAPRGFVEMCREEGVLCGARSQGDIAPVAGVTLAAASQDSAYLVSLAVEWGLPDLGTVVSGVAGSASAAGVEEAGHFAFGAVYFKARQPSPLAVILDRLVVEAGYAPVLPASLAGVAPDASPQRGGRVSPGGVLPAGNFARGAVDGLAAGSDREGAAAPELAALQDKKLWNLLRSVNREVNGKVVQQTDLRLFGRDDVWRRSGTGSGAAGDCEDIAIEKRLELLERGVPAERMFFAVTYNQRVGLHAVLLVRLDRGDYVLDSATPWVTLWSKAGYDWISIQSTGDPMQWHALGNGASAGSGLAV